MSFVEERVPRALTMYRLSIIQCRNHSESNNPGLPRLKELQLFCRFWLSSSHQTGGLMDRKTTFVLALAYLTIILALGLIYFVDRDLLFFVPKTGMFGPIPVGVPWFGAL